MWRLTPGAGATIRFLMKLLLLLFCCSRINDFYLLTNDFVACFKSKTGCLLAFCAEEFLVRLFLSLFLQEQRYRG